MADYAIPKNGAAYIFYGCLVSQADTKLFKSAPTLAAGDFKVSIDGGAFANLGTLPTNTPGTFAVKFTMSGAEMTGDNILVVASDAAGAEWCDQCWNIQTAARGVADLAYPTVTGRSLDVSATGEAGIDWANIGSPTTAQNLSATNIDVDQVVASVSGAVGSVTGAVGSVTGAVGSVTGAVGSVTGNVGGNVVGTVASVVGAVGSVTGNVGGNVVGSVASVVGAVGSVTGLTAANLDTTVSSRLSTAGYTAPPSVAAIADQVWDEILAGHLGVGSTGEALNAAGAAGDPWTTALPGAYGAGSAGNIIGNNINAPLNTIDTVVDAIKAKTDSLAFTVAGQVDANIQYVNDVQVTGNGSPGTEWGP